MVFFLTIQVSNDSKVKVKLNSQRYIGWFAQNLKYCQNIVENFKSWLHHKPFMEK